MLLAPKRAPGDEVVSTIKYAVETKNLRVGYSETPVLNGLNLKAGAGGLTILTAPNGAGKTTLFKAILGLLPYEGQIRLFSQDARRTNQIIGYVPQRAGIKWDMPLSALEVVTMGLYPKIGRFGFIRRNHRLEAMEYLKLVRLEHKAETPVGNLSGGEQQRVVVARALALKPSLYLVDEPFNNIDKATEELLIERFFILRSMGCSVFCIDHSPERFAKAAGKEPDLYLTMPTPACSNRALS